MPGERRVVDLAAAGVGGVGDGAAEFDAVRVVRGAHLQHAAAPSRLACPTCPARSDHRRRRRLWTSCRRRRPVPRRLVPRSLVPAPPRCRCFRCSAVTCRPPRPRPLAPPRRPPPAKPAVPRRRYCRDRRRHWRYRRCPSYRPLRRGASGAAPCGSHRRRAGTTTVARPRHHARFVVGGDVSGRGRIRPAAPTASAAIASSSAMFGRCAARRRRATSRPSARPTAGTPATLPGVRVNRAGTAHRGGVGRLRRHAAGAVVARSASIIPRRSSWRCSFPTRRLFPKRRPFPTRQPFPRRRRRYCRLLLKSCCLPHRRSLPKRRRRHRGRPPPPALAPPRWGEPPLPALPPPPHSHRPRHRCRSRRRHHRLRPRRCLIAPNSYAPRSGALPTNGSPTSVPLSIIGLPA